MYRGKGNTQGPKQRIKRTSDIELAKDIAESILSHRARGNDKQVEDYAKRPEIINMVMELLGGKDERTEIQ